MIDRQLNDQELRRLEELELIKKLGKNPYPQVYEKTHNSADILSAFTDETADQLADVTLGGRIMSIRKMGKASFFNLQDASGKIQIYLKKDDVGEETYNMFKLLDIGDIVGVKGFAFRTKTGEVSVHTKELTLLCKSLQPLPIAKEEIDENGNKIVHDAFADKELRYRKRYVDLIVNPDIKKVFVKRSKIISEMRRYFEDHGWIEVETPVLQPIYGGATARPFVSHHNALDIDLYMRIAIELYLKRLIVGGFEGVFEFGKNFRNEGMDKLHNPEFTMMEIYIAYKDYNWLMDMTEELIETIATKVNGTTTVNYGGHEISLARPYKRLKMFDLFKEHTGKDLRGLDRDALYNVAKELKIEVEPNAAAYQILDEIFGEMVEPHLIQPTFVIDYPVELSPLAKAHRSEEGLVERFELFVAGGEIANAFTELNDPVDQRERLESQSLLRAGGDVEAMTIDEDFLNAIEVGMPPTAGLGIGIDRFVMLITEQTSIRDVLFFPQMKPLD